VISPAARPRLASKAKLRHDKKTGQRVLLYPEKGLLLNATGAAIVSLCTGEHTVAEIVSQLQRDYTDGSVEGLEAEVHAFLSALGERGLIEGLAP
jgi:pyrroloquinoline quinone biosynthesis protein D